MRSPQLGPVPASEGAERHSPDGRLCPSCVLRGPAKGQKAVGPRQGLAGHPQDFRHPFKQRFLPCGSGSSLGTQGKLAMSAGAAGPTESRNVKTSAHRRTASCRSPSRAQRGAERSRRPSGRKPHAGALPGRQPSRCVCGTGPPSDRAARSPGAERTPAGQGRAAPSGADGIPAAAPSGARPPPPPAGCRPGGPPRPPPDPPAGPARGGASPRSPYLSTPRRHGAARSLGPPGGAWPAAALGGESGGPGQARGSASRRIRQRGVPVTSRDRCGAARSLRASGGPGAPSERKAPPARAPSAQPGQLAVLPAAQSKARCSPGPPARSRRQARARAAGVRAALRSLWELKFRSQDKAGLLEIMCCNHSAQGSVRRVFQMQICSFFPVTETWGMLLGVKSQQKTKNKETVP